MFRWKRRLWTDGSTASYYLRDLGHLLLAAAQQPRLDADAEPEDLFRSGRAAAYHEVISLMLSQADAFGVDPKVLALGGIDADRDLL